VTVGTFRVTYRQIANVSPFYDITCLVDSLTIRHGRDDTNSQPEADSCTLNMSDEHGEFWPPTSGNAPFVLDVAGTVYVWAYLGPDWYAQRFQGRITDIDQEWDDAGEDTPDHIRIQVVATGALSEMGRRAIGDEPWPQEIDGARMNRIFTAAGFAWDPATSDPGTVQILPRDVDNQPALEIAQSCAASASGILWSTRAGEIRYADADHRRNTVAALELDACDILVSPHWVRTTEGLMNYVSIGYGATPDGGDQPRYWNLHTQSRARYGRFDYSTTTELATFDDAKAYGQMLIARNRQPVWIMGALPVDVDGLSEADTQTLLTLEMHSLVLLTGLPAGAGAPTSAYLWVEGWAETLAYGVHELELIVSGYCRTAPAPQWDQMDPAKTWDSMGVLTWDDSACMGPTPDLGRWADVPASTRWDGIQPPDIQWNQWV